MLCGCRDLLLECGICSDGLMNLLIEVFVGFLVVISIETLAPLPESFLILLGVFLLNSVGPFLDVKAIDSASVVICIVFYCLSLVRLGGSWESPGVMGNVDATITGTFESTENSGTSGCSL